MSSDDSGALPEAGNTDIVDIAVTERAAVHVESDLLCCDIDSLHTPALECGVTVHQVGEEIAMKGGTVNESATPKLSTYNGLTPAQARRLADALETAADRAENAATVETDETDDRSLLGRLLG
jgi:hypothetical protein